MVLSGTVTSSVANEEIVRAATAPQEPSHLFGMMFAGFNEPFEAATGFEWLSPDSAEVPKYVDDPLSGMPLTNAALANYLPGPGQATGDEIRAACRTRRRCC